jgi:hypothetical protein
MLHKAGYRVVMAESLRWHLSSQSRSVARNYFVPWPSTHPDEYVESLAKIVDTENVDLVIPTCEEIYFIAERRSRLPGRCKLLAPDWTLLHSLHSKWEFIHLAGKHHLAVPETLLLQERAAVIDAWKSGRFSVFKPVYSRFASQAVVRPKSFEQLDVVQPTTDFPWVAQQFISGHQLSTYSLAYQGKLLVHAAYPMNFTTGIGPTFAYESIGNPAALEWVTKLVEAENFSGQIAFDFIEREDGSVVSIECNPRLTSGLHLFRDRIDVARAMVHPAEHVGATLLPNSRRPAQHALPLFLWALGYVRSWQELKRWARTFFWGRDVLLSWRDPLPLMLLGFNLWPVFRRARRHSVNIDQATTMDIEWNGARTIPCQSTQSNEYDSTRTPNISQ